ncbi:MAG: TetR family transcriptional regulator [Devosia sp.]|uniref:TetR/AcrR family transcriptional regulator n=1 Tax=Devosia sp. TaxID=1871048 RepID=UPI002616FAC8|nr:TetR/AcrR family transcriptional regulator [Devosia sp.]MDB5528899.1 TetR family transcriptional regulator [Devosia sp.]
MEEPAHRPRNATATRAAILASARTAFVRSGYEGAGLREIAEGAGVTAMMVNRYFGSKEGLFSQVLAAANADPIIATEEILHAADRDRRIAAALVQVTTPEATALDGFLIMLRSVSSLGAAAIARDVIESQHQRNVTAALSGASAAQRAALLMSLVAGVQIMRQVIQLKALTDVEPEALADLLQPLISALMDEKA